jgi:hypothetical protein
MDDVALPRDAQRLYHHFLTKVALLRGGCRAARRPRCAGAAVPARDRHGPGAIGRVLLEAWAEATRARRSASCSAPPTSRASTTVQSGGVVRVAAHRRSLPPHALESADILAVARKLASTSAAVAARRPGCSAMRIAWRWAPGSFTLWPSGTKRHSGEPYAAPALGGRTRPG